MNILEKIIKDKRDEIDYRRKIFPVESFNFKNYFSKCFLNGLNKSPIGFIAEIKRKSPSAGIIRRSFDVAKIVSDYEQNGATIISCLMDNKYFGGGEDDFTSVFQNTSLPILYKEFVIDEWQIKHANHIGASGILLIVSALDKKELNELFHCSIENNLTPLIEVHDEVEMETAIDLGAKCIGINNRNLKTFETSLDVTKNLLKHRPEDILVVSESGIKTSEDVYELSLLGVNALLVGEQLLKAESPGKELRSLLSKL